MMGQVGVFVFYGSALIIKVLSVWSFLLYAVYIVLAIACWLVFGDTIKDMVILYKEDSQWFLGGVKYAAYNLGGIPALLFSIRYIRVGENIYLRHPRGSHRYGAGLPHLYGPTQPISGDRI